MVEGGDAEVAPLALGEPRGGACQLRAGDPAALVLQRLGGVEADDAQPGRAVERLGRPPAGARTRARGSVSRRAEGSGSVVVSGHDEQRPAEAAQEGRGPSCWDARAAVGEVAGDDHKLRVEPLDQPGEGDAEEAASWRARARSDVQVGDVEDAC